MPTLSSRVHLDLSRSFFDYWEAPLLDIHLRIFEGSFCWKLNLIAGLVVSRRPRTYTKNCREASLAATLGVVHVAAIKEPTTSHSRDPVSLHLELFM